MEITKDSGNTLLSLINTAEAVNEPYEKTDENLERAAELEALGFSTLAQDILTKVQTKDKMARITHWGYLRITPAKIEQFLDKKVDLYNAAHPADPKEVVSRPSTFWTWNPDAFRPGTITSITPPHLSARMMMERRLLTGQIFSQPQGVAQFITGPESQLLPDVVKRSVQKISSKPTCHYLGGGDVGRYIWTETPLERYPTLPPEHILGMLKEHQGRKVFDYFTIAAVNAVRDPLLLGRVDGSEDRYYIAQWGDDVALEDVL